MSTQEMKEFLYSHTLLKRVKRGNTNQTQGEKLSFHRFHVTMTQFKTRRRRRILSFRKKNFGKSVQKFPVLSDEPCSEFKEKLKKSLGW